MLESIPFIIRSDSVPLDANAIAYALSPLSVICKDSSSKNLSISFKSYISCPYELIEEGKRDEGEELLENMKNASYIDLVYTTIENHQVILMGVEVSTSNYSFEDNSLHEQTAMELIQVQHYETIQI